jgi:hypothetical protein
MMHTPTPAVNGPPIPTRQRRRFSGRPAERLPAGTYSAVLDSVKRQTSAAGNPMDVAAWGVRHEGRPWVEPDYFVLNNCGWKLEKLARAWGLEARDLADLRPYIGRLVSITISVKATPKGPRREIAYWRVG